MSNADSFGSIDPVIGDILESIAHETERSKLKLIALGVNWEIASHVCNYYACGGVTPGSFICHLIRAMDAADPINMAKLSLGFPAYAAAVSAMKNWETGKDALISIAEGGRS